jgi:hypothetical protein
MALVICDSSTLIHLTSIGRLALLQTFYEQITIPPAVWDEVVEQGAGRAGAQEVPRHARLDGYTSLHLPMNRSSTCSGATSTPASQKPSPSPWNNRPTSSF